MGVSASHGDSWNGGTSAEITAASLMSTGVEYDESWSRSSNSRLLHEEVVGESGSFKTATGGRTVDCSSREPPGSSDEPSGSGGG